MKDSIQEILLVLEAVVAAGAQSNKKDIAQHITYDILYGNNTIEVDKLVREYPELGVIAETALEFDHQNNPQYLQECWNIIIANIKILKGKSRETSR